MNSGLMLVSDAGLVMVTGALLQASTMNKEELKDNAKEWLDKGGKWLMGAGKKLAAAAKEAQSNIQTRLEDMEVFKSSQGMYDLHRRLPISLEGLQAALDVGACSFSSCYR